MKALARCLAQGKCSVGGGYYYNEPWKKIQDHEGEGWAHCVNCYKHVPAKDYACLWLSGSSFRCHRENL